MIFTLNVETTPRTGNDLISLLDQCIKMVRYNIGPETLRSTKGPIYDAYQSERIGTWEIDTTAKEEQSDTNRLDWLAKHEAALIMHHEKAEDGHEIWWSVVRRDKSISGHPLGSPRAAVDAAIEAWAEKREKN